MQVDKLTTPENNARKGYPVGLTEIKVGQMTMPEILEGASMADAVDYKKTGHNEITITKENGVKVCRLRETNIATVTPERDAFLLNTGGWSTKTTRTHMVDFINRNLDLKIRVGGIKGGNQVRVFVDDVVFEHEFTQWIAVTIVNSQVKFISDRTE